MDNVHPGDILRDDFLIGSAIPLQEVAAASGVSETKLIGLLSGDVAVDATTDLRLARYFGVSEGLFMALQTDYDIEEAKRSLGVALDKIIPRPIRVAA